MKNYKCKECGQLVRARAVSNALIAEQLCLDCYAKKYELGKYAKE